MSRELKSSSGGVYIHVPFCKSRCIYCGFYSTVGTSLHQRYVDALCKELRRRLRRSPRTIYIGGGTPSQLSPAQLQQLFDTIAEVCGSDWLQAEGTPVEVTMECNPDDVTPEYAAAIHRLPINRVSLGIQTFDDSRLRFLRRRHTARQATDAVSRLRAAGISNISIDLMFGFPGETLAEWQADLARAISLDVEHISAYSLMYEEDTPLCALLDTGEVEEIDESLSNEMYDLLVSTLASHGYEHYEVSNFARRGFRSRHNSSYWSDVPYIGIGAAAHSYDLRTRRWNVPDMTGYIQAIEKGERCWEEEYIDLTTHFNDMVTTRLRTCEGIDLEWAAEEFGPKAYTHLLSTARKTNALGHTTSDNGRLRLTLSGLHIADTVMSEYIWLEEDGAL